MGTIVGRDDNDFREMAGDVPRLAQIPVFYGAQHESQQVAAGQGGKTTKSLGRLNMRAVADVLETYGLDPIEEVAKVLVQQEPLLDKHGQPVLDAEGKPVMKPALPSDVRLRTLLELAQYARPKLKAVEITNKEPELTEEQLDRRLEALMAARNKTGGQA